MSGLCDIMSPLRLIWTKTGFDAVNGLADFGNIEGLWKPEYDPCIDNTWEDGTTTNGIFTIHFKQRNPSEGWGQMQSFYKKTSVKIWQLCPPIVQMAGERASWSSSFGQNVVSVILRTLSLRRSLYSPLRLPDGSVSYPGADLLPMTIATEELSYDQRYQTKIKEHGQTIASDLFATSRSGTFKLNKGTLADTRERGLINFSAYRKGIMVAHDWRNQEILRVIEKASGAIRGANGTRLRLRLRWNIPKRYKVPTVGIKHIGELLSIDKNAGLDFFFTSTCLDPDVIAPAGRSGWLYWLCATSPILARSLELAHRYIHEQKERLIIFVDTLWIQQ